MFEFLKALEGRPDHPMATPAEARRILATLADEKSDAALEQFAHWAGSLRDSGGFACDDRLAVIKEIDQEARTRVDGALAGYFAQVHVRNKSQKRTFELLYDYWTRLSEAYARCVADHEQGEKGAARVRQDMALAIARSLRAAGQAARMRCMRYLGIDKGTWPGLCRLVAYAELLGIDDAPVVPYPKEVHSNTRAEFLKILGLNLAALHEIPPDQIELAYRILGRFAPSFAWSRQPSAECNFAIDLSAQAPPYHMRSKEPQAPAKRYFGGGPALAKLAEIERLSEANLLSEELRFGKEFSPAQIVSVMRHIRTYLGTEPPPRRYARATVDVDLAVIHGFRAICQRVTAIELGSGLSLGDDLDVQQKKKTALELTAEEIESVPETWRLKDRSEWGLGADIPTGCGAWAEPGVACAIRESAGAQRADAPWWVGIIRGFEVDDAGRMHCGFWIVSKKPVSVWLRVLGTEGQQASNWESSTGSFAYRYMPAIFLPDALKSHENPVLLMERQDLALGELCEVMVGEHSRTIEFVELLEHGSDYMRVAFAWRQPAKK